MELDGRQTEKHALEQEEAVLELYKYVDEKIPVYQECFRECFTADKSRRLDLLKGICKELAEHGVLDSDAQFVHMNIAAYIYEQELMAGEKCTIFDIAHSLKDILDLYSEIKFLLWRIEFGRDIQAKNTLISLVSGFHLSPYYIRRVIAGVTMDKIRLLPELSELFLDRGMVRYAYHMLLYLNELVPDKPDVLALLADICRMGGNEQKAQEYLERLGNAPGGGNEEKTKAE